MKRQFDEFLKDIIEEIDIIKQATESISFKEFQNDKIVVRAVTKSFEIMGEAIYNIPDEIKDKYKEIPWRNIKDFRNMIIHQYWSIDYDIEWKIIKT